MGKPIRPVIPLAVLGSMMAGEPPAQTRVLSPSQEADFAELVGWLRKLVESPFKGSVTLHLNGRGLIDRNVQLRANFLLDTGREKG